MSWNCIGIFFHMNLSLSIMVHFSIVTIYVLFTWWCYFTKICNRWKAKLRMRSLGYFRSWINESYSLNNLQHFFRSRECELLGSSERNLEPRRTVQVTARRWRKGPTPCQRHVLLFHRLHCITFGVPDLQHLAHIWSNEGRCHSVHDRYVILWRCDVIGYYVIHYRLNVGCSFPGSLPPFYSYWHTWAVLFSLSASLEAVWRSCSSWVLPS